MNQLLLPLGSAAQIKATADTGIIVGVVADRIDIDRLTASDLACKMLGITVDRSAPERVVHYMVRVVVEGQQPKIYVVPESALEPIR